MRRARYLALALLGMVLIGSRGAAIWRANPRREIQAHTFSLVAFDPVAKHWGCAVASRVLAVGAIVPWARANVGAVATQALTNRDFGPKGLALLAKGMTPEAVMKALKDSDANIEVRQFGIVDKEGNAASFTGAKCNAWAGHKTGKNYACQGNLLAGPDVISAMAKAFEGTKGRLAWRLMAALEAGDKAGGDRRGKQSAAILIVADRSGGRGGAKDRMLDLRVDDHKEPVAELARLLTIRYGGRPKK